MHNTSYHGLEFWAKSVFEKLGWMVLAQEAKEKNHIKCYIENIELLLSHINDKLASVNSNVFQTNSNSNRLSYLESAVSSIQTTLTAIASKILPKQVRTREI